jgi:hypothetical protein
VGLGQTLLRSRVLLLARLQRLLALGGQGLRLDESGLEGVQAAGRRLALGLELAPRRAERGLALAARRLQLLAQRGRRRCLLARGGELPVAQLGRLARLFVCGGQRALALVGRAGGLPAEPGEFLLAAGQLFLTLGQRRLQRFVGTEQLGLTLLRGGGELFAGGDGGALRLRARLGHRAACLLARLVDGALGLLARRAQRELAVDPRGLQALLALGQDGAQVGGRVLALRADRVRVVAGLGELVVHRCQLRAHARQRRLVASGGLVGLPARGLGHGAGALELACALVRLGAGRLQLLAQ